MANPEKQGIPLAGRLAALKGVPDQLQGEIAISVLEEFYCAYRDILVAEVEQRPYLSSYLTAYDQVTRDEIVALRDLGPDDKILFGAVICQSGLIYEFTAYHELLQSRDPQADGKKKEGGKHLVKELEDLKKANEDWIPVPKWLEIVLKSILDIFD